MAKEEEGLDILKFFIGVMSLLTIVVAGFAGYNWSNAEALAERVEEEASNAEQVKKIAGNADFKMAIARSRVAKELDTRTADLGRFLTEAATLMRFSLKSNVAEGGGAGSMQRGYVKKSHRITIERQSLEVIADYLFYVQANWPGLKIEELSVKEAATKKGEPWQGWTATVLVTIYRPKE
jgi:hypothetical protein